MSKIVEKLFAEIKEEARTGEINYQELLYGTIYDSVFRMKFNVVEQKEQQDMYNFYINNYNFFIKKLDEYIYSIINLYKLEINEYEIKKILILLWSNITNNEMYNIDNYVDKYIKFINNNDLLNQSGSKEINELGLLNYSFDIQSYKQETPYCFNSYFSNNGINYYLPRISYGIKDGKCYIYAIQNKAKNDTTDEQIKYGEIVKKRINTLNSGVKEYRNVTPSALISLILFISILKSNNINELEVVCNLPIRHQNRKLVNDYKLQMESKYKNIEEIEQIKNNMLESEIRIYYNTVIKFQNSFKRLINHFKIIMRNFENELNENLLLEVISLDTNNELIKQIINESEEYNYGKSIRSKKS